MIINTGDGLLKAIKDFIDAKTPKMQRQFSIMLVFYIVLFGIIVFLSIDSLTAKTLGGKILEFFGVGLIIVLIVFLIGLATNGIALIPLAPLLPLMLIPITKSYPNYKKTRRLINNSKCNFTVHRDKKYFIAEFFVPANDMIFNQEIVKEILQDVIVKLIPYLEKYDFHIEAYAISTHSLAPENSIISDTEEVILNEVNISASRLSPQIRDKGIEMSRVYILLYCLENVLRKFIEDTSIRIHGEDYINVIHVNNSIKRKISDRQAKESINKYISLRGNSDLYYMDFKELGDIIVNNQFLLDYFPNQNWIKAKISELGNVRNLIAHNSYVGKHEIDIIKVNFNSISRQIGEI